MEPEESRQVRDALDLMGKALADHQHQWTNEERSRYEKAVKILSRDMEG